MYKIGAFITFGCWALLIAGVLGQEPASAPARPSLDYEFFKTKVQPIFLNKRPGHARCIACHGRARRCACSRSTRARRPGPTKSRARTSMWSGA